MTLRVDTDGRLGKPRRVALVRALRGLGDMLCAIPALRSLRAGLPEAHVTLVGLPESAWLLERYPGYVDELLEFPGFPGVPEVPLQPARLARFIEEVNGKFDLAVQMHGSGLHTNGFTVALGARRTAGYYLPALWQPDPELFIPFPPHEHEIRRWTALVRHLGMPDEGEWLEFPLQERDHSRAARLLDRPGPTRYVCVHPGATDELRRWPVERFAAAADWLARQGYRVLLTGSRAERSLTRRVRDAMTEEAVDVAGATDLGGMAALLAGCSLLLCNDTGVSHLAAAVRAPSVVVFSASDPAQWAPLDRELHRIVGEPMPERANHCRHTPELKGHRCLGDGCGGLRLVDEEKWQPASVADVLTAAEAQLQRSSGAG